VLSVAYLALSQVAKWKVEHDATARWHRMDWRARASRADALQHPVMARVAMINRRIRRSRTITRCRSRTDDVP
jgi:hypothetical protein